MGVAPARLSPAIVNHWRRHGRPAARVEPVARQADHGDGGCDQLDSERVVKIIADLLAWTIVLAAEPQALDGATADAVRFLHKRIEVRKREEEDAVRPTLQ